MKRSRRRVGVVLALALAWAVGLTASTSVAADEAATVTELGWWRSVGVSEPPEGGFAVGQSLGEPTSVAALRIAVPGETPTFATLTLTESDGFGAETAALQVCPTPDTWETASGGGMEDAPEPACDRGSVVLARDDTGDWSANVASLLDGPSVSLMVVPAESEPESEDPLAGAGAGFDLAFEPPALVAPAPFTSDVGSGDTSPPTQTETFPAPEPAPSSSSEASSPDSGDPNPPFSAAPLDRGEVGLAPTAEATDEPPTDDQVAIAPSTPLPQRLASTEGGGGRPWGQAVSYTLIAAVLGTGAGVGRWQLRERGILGATA